MEATRTRARAAAAAPAQPAAAAPAPVRSRRAINITPPAQSAAPAVVQPVAPARTPVAGELNEDQKTQLNTQLAAWNEGNLEKNRYTRVEKTAADTTQKLMREWGVTSFSYAATYAGATRTIEARIGAKVGERLNMAKLRTLVPDETFMKIVSATKEAVKDHAGTNVLLQITETVTVPDCFSLKAAK